MSSCGACLLPERYALGAGADLGAPNGHLSERATIARPKAGRARSTYRIDSLAFGALGACKNAGRDREGRGRPRARGGPAQPCSAGVLSAVGAMMQENLHPTGKLARVR